MDFEDIVQINEYDDNISLTTPQRSLNTISLNISSQQKQQQQINIMQIPKINASTSYQAKYQLETKKVITKVKRTSSKKYKRKQMAIVPLLQTPLVMSNNFVLFGYQLIEQDYRNYDNMLDCTLQAHISEQLFVNNVSQIKKNGYFEMSLSNIRCSGIQNFQFLIDHFQRQPNAQYKALGDTLQDYQSVVEYHVNHLRQIQKKIRRGLISIEKDIYPVIAQAKEYFQQYLKANFSQSFARFSIMTSDFREIDIQISSHGFTEKYAELVGINIHNAEDYLIAKVNNQYGEADERLNSRLELMQVYSKDIQKKGIPMSFYTNDGILIRTNVDGYNVYYPDLPDWLQKLDLVMYVCKFNITESQQKYVAEQRKLINNALMQPKSQNYVDFEQLVLSEIFIEKYYSNHITQNQFKEDKQAGVRDIQA